MSQNKYPISVPFLCHAIAERQKFNRFRLSACQKGSHIHHDNVFRLAKKEDQKKIQRLSEEWNKVYEDAKVMCKNYSKVITAVRKEMGAKIEWGTTANVISFLTKDGVRICSTEFHKMSQSFLMDEMLFPELKVELPHNIEQIEKRYNALNHVTKEFRKHVKEKYNPNY